MGDRQEPSDTQLLLEELRTFDADGCSAASVQRLLEVSRHRSPVVRRASISALADAAGEPALGARLIAMIADEDCDVARLAVLRARHQRVRPNGRELEDALAHGSDFVANSTVALLDRLDDPILGRLLSAMERRPGLALVVLPKLVGLLDQASAVEAFLTALASPLVDVRACAYRTLIANRATVCRNARIKRALVDATTKLDEIYGPAARTIDGDEPS